MSVLLVDWLGRGGIAQTSEAWLHELGAVGCHVCVVTRGGRELGETARRTPHGDLVEANAARRIAAHRRVVAAAVDALRERRPSCVVIQNYILPVLEQPLYRAAKDGGTRVVVVVHDDRPHTAKAGNRLGLRALLRHADAIVAHSHYVGDAVAAWARRVVQHVPHPVQVGMLTRSAGSATFATTEELFGLHFGTLHRRYKGSPLVADLAGHVPGWTFGAVGVGAPASRPGLASAPGWISSADLVATVRVSDAAILPYRHATQSGAIVLAQALGAVPVTTAVGALPEQVDHDVDGLLLQPDAPVADWRDALERLADDEHRLKLSTAGRERVQAGHAEFVRAARALVA